MLCSFSHRTTKDIENPEKGNWENEQKRAGSFGSGLVTGSRNCFHR